MSSDWDTRRVARTVLIIAVVLLSVWMLWRFLPALAWAGVLAIATWPLREGLARRGLGKTTSAILLTLLLAVVLVLPLIWLGVQVAHEGHPLAQWLSNVGQQGFGTPEWLAQIPYVGNRVAAWWQANLAEPGAAQSLLGRTGTGGMLNLTRTLGIQVASRLTILVFSLLALFFLYRDGPSVIAEAHVIANRLFGPSGGQLGKNVIGAVRGTVNGLVLVGLVEGVLLGIAYVAAGLHHAAVLALATGVLGTVPFGAPLVYILCALYLFSQSQTTAAIAVLVFGSVVVFLADHFVRPILIGSATRLPFLWVLLGIFGGLETFGLIGLFLGPAIISVPIAMWREGATSGEG